MTLSSQSPVTSAVKQFEVIGLRGQVKTYKHLPNVFQLKRVTQCYLDTFVSRLLRVKHLVNAGHLAFIFHFSLFLSVNLTSLAYPCCNKYRLHTCHPLAPAKTQGKSMRPTARVSICKYCSTVNRDAYNGISNPVDSILSVFFSKKQSFFAYSDSK